MITFTEKQIRIIHYNRILKVNNDEIHIQYKKMQCQIYGNDLLIYYMDPNEVIIQGKLMKVEFVYD
ncbi:MAG: YabP/YqfC family sporulation protein [Traorella sp.]